MESDPVASTRDRILRAALEVTHEGGFSAEITDIARRANVGVGTVYRHFESREQLLRVLVREVVDLTRQDLTRIAAEVADPETAIRETMRVGFRRVEKYGQLCIEMTAGAFPPHYSEVRDGRDEMTRLFHALIRRGIQDGCFPESLDVDYAVAAWFALVAPRMLSNLRGERSADELAAATTGFFIAGLKGMQEQRFGAS